MYFNVVIAGFGGQGVLLAGKVLAKAAILEDKYITWMPSYGVEMRGGTANSTIVISDEEIGSPVTGTPLNVIALNYPSKVKFEKIMKSDGLLLLNSSLIDEKACRDDIKSFCIPANKIAEDIGSVITLNIVALGAFVKLTKIVEIESVKKSLEEIFIEKPGVIGQNIAAFNAGVSFVENTKF